MKIIIIRHGEKDGDNLTPKGVAEAKALAAHIGDFATALSSKSHRAAYTAELVSRLSVQTDARANIPTYAEHEFNRLARLRQAHPQGALGVIWESETLVNDVREAGQKLLELVKETMLSLSEGERALIVSHDGTIIGLDKLVRHESFASLNRSFEPLQGISIDDELAVRAFN